MPTRHIGPASALLSRFSNAMRIVLVRLIDAPLVIALLEGSASKNLQFVQFCRRIILDDTAGNIAIGFHHQLFCFLDRILGPAGLADKYAVVLQKIVAATHFTNKRLHVSTTLVMQWNYLLFYTYFVQMSTFSTPTPQWKRKSKP